MGQWHVGRFTRSHRKRHANDFGLHIVQAGGLGIKSEQIRILDFRDPLIQLVHCLYHGDIEVGTLDFGYRLRCSKKVGAQQLIKPGLELKLPVKCD